MENERKDRRKRKCGIPPKNIKNLKESNLLSVSIGQEKEPMDYLNELMQVYASIAPGRTDYVSLSVILITGWISQIGCMRGKMSWRSTSIIRGW